MFASLLGAAAVVCLSVVGLERSQLLLTIAFIGMGLQAGTVGQIALAVKLYPAAMRTTGVGCAAAAGRIGSILGPAIGGMLLSLQMPSSQIVLTACLPILAAALAVGILAFHGRRAGTPPRGLYAQCKRLAEPGAALSTSGFPIDQ
jgi:AAHS family 4-hydroxybenzoate transporter-like MFS transporter